MSKSLLRSLALALLLVGLIAPASLSAQTTTRSATTGASFPLTTTATSDEPVTSESEQLDVNTVSGRILRLGEREITIENQGEATRFSLTDDVRITRNSQVVDFAELKVNDQATVTVTTEGEVLSIDVIGSQVADITSLLLPLGLLIGAILLLILFAVSRMGRGKIRTTTSH